MPILISSFLFFLSALTVMILRVTPASTRATWLMAVGGAALTLFSVLLWLAFLPIQVSLSAWQPQTLFVETVSFHADGVIFPLAFSVAVLTLAVILTAAARSLTNSFFWAGALALGGLGLLSVSANNPLTLALVWSALDFTELLAQLRSVNGASPSERAVISFSVRLLGIWLLLWANFVSAAAGGAFDFESVSASAGLYLILAAGLRLGVIPLRLPYAPESSARRGFGTALRLISAVSSLALLAHLPTGSFASSSLALWMLALTALAALYAGWMWLRAPDELSARPYWVIGASALSIASALNGSSLGVAAWGGALVLVGSSLFLASIRNVWLNRALLFGVWSLSSLPFSLAAAANLNQFPSFVPFLSAAQALLAAGFARHALRPGSRDSLDEQPAWMRSIYLLGASLLILAQLWLSLAAWDGALQVGAPLQALTVVLLTAALIWATPRLRVLNPIRAHWVNSAASRVNNLYQSLWGVYRFMERISQTINRALEGESGLMWTLLFLALFLSWFGGAR